MNEGKDHAETNETEWIRGLAKDFPELSQFLIWYSSSEPKPNLTAEEFKNFGFDILPKEKQIAIADFLKGRAFDKTAEKWNYYESQAKRIAMYFRPILLAVDLEFFRENALISKLMKALRNHLVSEKPNATLLTSLAPELIEKLPKKALRLLQSRNESNEINVARFEFYVYEKMYHQIEQGRLFCNDSVSFCDLDYDLVPDELVNQAEKICEELGYKKIPIYCDEHFRTKIN